MADGRRPLWRRVRWANVGRLCVLLAAAGALAASVRGGGGEPQGPTVAPSPPTPLREERLGGERSGRRGSPGPGSKGSGSGRAGRVRAGEVLERGSAARKRQTSAARRRRARALERRAGAPTAAKEAGTAAPTVPTAAKEAGADAQAELAAVEDQPLMARPPNGEFTPDPGPWR